jgi:hypothetical protein
MMSSYTCPLCSKSEPEVHKAFTNRYCNECKKVRDKIAKQRRRHPPEPSWDIVASYQWLYKLYNGYHLSDINIARKPKKPIKAEGHYNWAALEDV